MALARKICVVADCERSDVHARGLCHMHYQRYRVRGDPNAQRRIFPRFSRLCSADGCMKKHYCRDFCVKHYSEWKARQRGVPKRVVRVTCEVPGCTRRHAAKGLCHNHYNMKASESGHHTLMCFLGLDTWR